ncbi:hypothetical protein M9H77_23339 [Catharanthus roseus]|uniref:Uncharacterized protein n=1 Tax=Catharanthus roseus TaxID=4058 RepID=A0ACC0ATF0_CATRO|nr:hypothetical protein M9H77_23339 [Catharanthus roseus]
MANNNANITLKKTEEGQEALPYINPLFVPHPSPLMAEKTMADYARLPRIDANNFEIKPNVIQILQNNVQFDGLLEEDPNAHIGNFLEMVGIPFAQAEKLPPIFGNVLTSALE